MLMELLFPVAALGAMGLLFGLMLGGASKLFRVEVDEKVPLILEVLPGANCGGCGYAGCNAYATAVSEGNAPLNGCPVGGKEVGDQIAKIMGASTGEYVKKVARVHCLGCYENARQKYEYSGIQDCIVASKLGGGQKDCPNGCLGLGTCQRACPFGAIEIENGLARINEEKCTACGKCVQTCPKNVITLVPQEKKYMVMCNNHDKGPVAKDLCKVSCIGCRLCEKECTFDAIHVHHFAAEIDYEKCRNCGKCMAKCPRHVIVKC